MLTVLRVINLVIWALLLANMLPGAWAFVRGKNVHRSDPMWLSVAAVCVVIMLGNLRFLLAPDSEVLFAAVYVLSAVVGLYKIVLAQTYGRGPKL